MSLEATRVVSIPGSQFDTSPVWSAEHILLSAFRLLPAVGERVEPDDRWRQASRHHLNLWSGGVAQSGRNDRLVEASRSAGIHTTPSPRLAPMAIMRSYWGIGALGASVC